MSGTPHVLTLFDPGGIDLPQSYFLFSWSPGWSDLIENGLTLMILRKHSEFPPIFLRVSRLRGVEQIPQILPPPLGQIGLMVSSTTLSLLNSLYFSYVPHLPMLSAFKWLIKFTPGSSQIATIQRIKTMFFHQCAVIVVGTSGDQIVKLWLI